MEKGDADQLGRIFGALRQIGTEQIIVELPRRKADSIRILARYPDGSLKVPEFSFNPVKWADAYDLQKRTGYVFAPREVLLIVALAAKVVFLTEFGVVMNGNADGSIKAGQTIGAKWIDQLADQGVIDQDVVTQLQTKQESLLSLQRNDLAMPKKWVSENQDLPFTLLSGLKKGLKGGLTYTTLPGFRKTMEAMFAFMDMWYDGNEIVSDVKDEADFQERLTRHFRSRSVSVEEGTAVGGGKLDLLVAGTVLIENKYVGSETTQPATAAPCAGAQGRRYAIALQSQIVLSVAAVQVKKGEEPPQRSDMIEVRESNTFDTNRTEIRFTVPFGCVRLTDASVASESLAGRKVATTFTPSRAPDTVRCQVKRR